MELSLQKADFHLLRGCCLEAERADMVSVHLEGLRQALPETYGGHLAMLVEEMRSSARVLRDLADLSQMHFNRVPILLNYLNIVLPCLSRTLRDIINFYETRTLSKEMRWRKMYHTMTQEVGGLPLPQRFLLYNHFLTSLKQLLIRSPNFDLNGLESLRTRIIGLREARGLPTPSTQVGPVLRPEVMILPTLQDPNAHWAEQIFSLPLPSRTALKHNRSSEARGQFVAWGQLNIPKETKMLFRRTGLIPLHRKSNHRVWLKDVQLYVFCHRYRQQNQRKGQAGAFEINFVSDEGAKRFREVFAPAHEDTSEVSMEAIEDAK
ncbi:hypothetical protein K4K61_008819 [Colletotrichum sp. SAR11_59]|nr:hypothetical protein K4K61_008819 [Colletotrichum sp. SAR11_59]